MDTQPNSKPSLKFNWNVEAHHVNLYPQGGAAQQQIPFNFGPDAKSVFLKQPDGRSREYMLVTNSDSGG